MDSKDLIQHNENHSIMPDHESIDPRLVLSKKLPPEFIRYRRGAGNSRLAYLEGWRAINLANRIFGYNGWSSSVVNMNVDDIKERPDGRVSVCISSTVRVTLRDGTYHEDVGHGSIDNAPSKSMAFEKARKEAVTDGLKRALRMFGDLLGNCLYNRDFVSNIEKISKRKFKEEYTEKDLYYPNSPSNHSITKPLSIPNKPAQMPDSSRRNVQPTKLPKKPETKIPKNPISNPKTTSNVVSNSNRHKHQLRKEPSIKALEDFVDIFSQDDFHWDSSFDDVLGVIEYLPPALDDIELSPTKNEQISEDPNTNKNGAPFNKDFSNSSVTSKRYDDLPMNSVSNSKKAKGGVGNSFSSSFNTNSFSESGLATGSFASPSSSNPKISFANLSSSASKNTIDPPKPEASQTKQNNSKFVNMSGFIPASHLNK
ncbi:hypothetical protein BB560_002913 [Smittium megazygosporum]|uniref:DNA repair and recombination protein RAD52 n=1 Tax=Smittium megazygosporum TaxID=133381 RepID=A0A2T9ZDK6_9FUNG|nr:hypothetical protein BB560_002913 [Smittium megazygosporum]